MKHWQIALAIFASLSASLALADDFKTVSGKEYKDATVSRVEADGIVIRTKRGISKVYFTELPKDVQERFHYHFAQDAHVTPDGEAMVEQENAAPAGHPLGGTADQFAARYGAPNDSPVLDKNFPLLQDAIHHTYTYEGWRIRAAFVPPDGPAVRMWAGSERSIRRARPNQCDNAEDPNMILDVQVVPPIAYQNFWRQLSSKGSIQ